MKKKIHVDQEAFEASVTETMDVIQAFKRKRSKKASDIPSENLKVLKQLSEENKAPVSITPSLKPLESRYEILEKKGQGGMKEVYLAKDLEAFRQIAYAQIRSDKIQTINYRRFIREARISALLEHPNIIPVHDVGVNENGQPYFTMKLLEGKDLQTVLKELAKGDGELLKEYSPQRMLEVFMDCCRAIAYAHSKGILHLDLKPANVHVSHFGEVLVLDWGIASFFGEVEGRKEIEHIPQLDSESTMSGTLKGTPGYMAPEQINPKLAAFSERTDVYQLGCLLYAMLTFRPPILKKGVREMLDAAVNGDIDLLKNKQHKIPPPLEAVVLKAMSVNPEDRYQSVSDLIKDIQAYQDGYSTSAWNAGLWSLGVLAYKRHQTKIITGLCFVLVILGVTIAFMVELVKSNRAAIRARDLANVLADQVSEALDVAKEKEAIAKQKSEEALMSDRQLNDFKEGIEGSFEIARERLPQLLEDIIKRLKGYGRLDVLKFMMENDYQSFLKYPYDAVWMLFENQRISAKKYHSLIEAVGQNPELDSELYQQLVSIMAKMKFEDERVPVEDCHLALSILRDHVEIAPNSIAAYVMHRYHEKYLDDPTYPSYLEKLFELNSVMGQKHEADIHELSIKTSPEGWDLELSSTLKNISLSSLAYLPVRSFKAVGCWAKDYVTLSTWPLEDLNLESSSFKIENNWRFQRLQLDTMRLVDCPFMNWPRLVDTLPSKELIVKPRAAEYLNREYMKSRGVSLLID